MRKYVLDSNCYIDASRSTEALAALQRFVAWTAPGLHVSYIVAAELRAGARSPRHRRTISANAKDLTRIRRVFAFDFVAPFPAAP